MLKKSKIQNTNLNRQTTSRTITATNTSAVTIIPTSNPEKSKKVER